MSDSMINKSLVVLSLTIAAFATVTAADAKSSGRLDCMAGADDGSQQIRSCSDLNQRRKVFIPPPRRPQPPTHYGWRDQIFDNTHSGGEGSEGGGGGGAGGNR